MLSQPTLLEQYLATLEPMPRGRARKTLDMQVRRGDGRILTRAQIIEEDVCAGATLQDVRYRADISTVTRRKLKNESECLFREAVSNRASNPEHPAILRRAAIKDILDKGTQEVNERALKTLDGSFRGPKEITLIGLDYADFLLTKQDRTL